MSERILLDAIDAVYSALDDCDGINDLTRRLGSMLGADAGDIITERPEQGAIITHGSFGFDPEFLDEYDATYLGRNPWVTELLLKGAGQAHSDETDSRTYRASDYFNTWVRAQGFDRNLGALVDVGPSFHTWVGFVRCAGHGSFSETDRRFLDKLIPHLRRVIALQSALDGETTHKALLERLPRPVFLLDRIGRVSDLNAQASKLLKSNGPLDMTREGRLRAARRHDTARINAIVQTALGMVEFDAPSDSTLTTSIRHDGEDFGLSAIPLRSGGPVSCGAQVAISVCLPNIEVADLNDFKCRFGLSPTETALARWIAKGGDIRGFAANRAIAPSTARWHLKNLEAKCGTGRIEALVALIHGSCPVLTPPIREGAESPRSG